MKKKKRTTFIESDEEYGYIPLYGMSMLFTKEWFKKECIDPYGFVYKITNINNNKVYIGQTIQDIVVRYKAHLYSAMTGKGYYLHEAIRKHGDGAFELECIKKCYSKKDMHDTEVFWIKKCQSYKPEFGYNVVIHDKSFDYTNYGSLFYRNNPMTGKSLYELWVERYGKDEADIKLKKFKKKQADIGKLKFKNGKLNNLLKSEKSMTKAGKERLSKSMTGNKNPMYGISLYQHWVNKYGKEEADRRSLIRKEKCKQTRIKNANKK